MSEPAELPPDDAAAAFDAFSLYTHRQDEPTHWLAALFGSSIVYVLLAVAAVTIGTAARRIIVEKEVEVKFVEEVAKPEPPPPPKPVEIVKPPPVAAPPAAAPVVPENMKVQKLDAPPPSKELVAPDEMPNQIPAEADPSLDKGIAVYGDGIGDVAGLEGGIAGGAAGGVAGLQRIPEEADPAVPAKGNRPPVYPELAKRNKQTGTVVLRVLILATGEVSEVTVLSGEEPFASEAVKSVKKWRYRPARFNGDPISTFKIIRIPFKLTA